VESWKKLLELCTLLDQLINNIQLLDIVEELDVCSCVNRSCLFIQCARRTM